MKNLFRNHGALIALVVLIIVNVGWQGSAFYNPDNLRNLLSQNSAKGIVALGMTLVIISAGIDLSVGSMVGLLGVFCLLAMNKIGGDATLAGVLVCIFGGGLLGLLNGTLITLGRIAPFVTTLAGLGAFRSLALAITQGGQLTTTNETFQKIANDGVSIPFIKNKMGVSLEVYYPIFLFAIFAVLTWWILDKTIYGRRLIATGANEQAARYSGINTNAVKVWAYVILGLLVGVASVCKTSQLNSVAPGSSGLYMELDAIAAVVVGGTSLAGGRGKIGATVIGVLILGIIDNMLPVAGIDANWQGCVKGVIILLAVLMQRGNTAR
ncbi:MAG TPA: ABC transporter permease [Fimbriimonas sp.]|nr:ABC transporter permease [Fimbriimonas sp.]